MKVTAKYFLIYIKTIKHSQNIDFKDYNVKPKAFKVCF